MAGTPRNPHPETSSPITDLALEAQIVHAEQAVIRRDERIRRTGSALIHRVKHETVRHAGSGLLVGVGTLVAAWWFRRRHPAPAPAPATGEGSAPPHSDAEHLLRDAGLSLAGLLPIIWPLLPRGLRRSLTPKTAGTLLTFLSPLVARLFRRKRRRAPAA